MGVHQKNKNLTFSIFRVSNPRGGDPSGGKRKWSDPAGSKERAGAFANGCGVKGGNQSWPVPTPGIWHPGSGYLYDEGRVIDLLCLKAGSIFPYIKKNRIARVMLRDDPDIALYFAITSSWMLLYTEKYGYMSLTVTL